MFLCFFYVALCELIYSHRNAPMIKQKRRFFSKETARYWGFLKIIEKTKWEVEKRTETHNSKSEPNSRTYIKFSR